MIGPEGAASLLVARYAMALPAKTAELRDRLEVDDAFALPNVQTVCYGPAPSTSMEAWPIVETYSVRSEPVRSNGDGTWSTGYVVRTYAWTRSTNPDEVARVRDRLTLALSEVLLAGPVLATGVVVRDGWSWSMSDLLNDDQQRTLGGVYFELVLDVEESLDPADDVDVPRIAVYTLDTTAVPPARAL